MQSTVIIVLLAVLVAHFVPGIFGGVAWLAVIIAVPFVLYCALRLIQVTLAPLEDESIPIIYRAAAVWVCFLLLSLCIHSWDPLAALSILYGVWGGFYAISHVIRRHRQHGLH
jgi:hypothetical protein